MPFDTLVSSYGAVCVVAFPTEFCCGYSRGMLSSVVGHGAEGVWNLLEETYLTGLPATAEVLNQGR